MHLCVGQHDLCASEFVFEFVYLGLWEFSADECFTKKKMGWLVDLSEFFISMNMHILFVYVCICTVYVCLCVQTINGSSRIEIRGRGVD